MSTIENNFIFYYTKFKLGTKKTKHVINSCTFINRGVTVYWLVNCTFYNDFCSLAPFVAGITCSCLVLTANNFPLYLLLFMSPRNGLCVMSIAIPMLLDSNVIVRILNIEKQACDVFKDGSSEI